MSINLNKTLTKIVVSLVILAGGFYLGRSTSPESKTEIKYRERIKREIVRITNPDGTIKETIKETEKNDGIVTKVDNKRLWQFDVSYAPSEESTYNLGVGYRVLSNVSIRANLVRHRGHSIPMIGVGISF